MSDSCIYSLPTMDDDDASAYVPRRSQRAQRIDYHLLNDGSDSEAPTEARIFKRPRLNNPKESPEPIMPDDTVSQLDQNRSSPVESLQQNRFPEWESSKYPSVLPHPYLAADRRMIFYGPSLLCLHS
jgi:hypothetical protein